VYLQGLFGEDWPACVEEFFGLLQLHLVFAPHLLASPSSGGVVSQVLGLACLCLQQCREREPLRAVLRAVQGLFLPTSFKAQRSNECDKGEEQLLLLQSCAQGSQVVFLLLALLASGGESLVPNLADSLQAVITGCHTHCNSSLMTECRSWVHSALPAAFPRIAHYERVASAFLRLGERRDRRLRSLAQDLAKIAAGELTEDSLLAYDEDA